MSTNELLAHHIQALIDADLEAIMSDYAEDIVFINQDGAIQGLDALRKVFKGFVGAFPAGSTINVTHQIIDGDYAYILWNGESRYLTVPFASDSFVAKGGKFVFQTFAGQLIPKKK